MIRDDILPFPDDCGIPGQLAGQHAFSELRKVCVNVVHYLLRELLYGESRVLRWWMVGWDLRAENPVFENETQLANESGNRIRKKQKLDQIFLLQPKIKNC
jgi:hypothetical protein